ncbi:hypothetical protein [Kitasatospora sp. NPDC059160]|uniref:hypothetical protein n=1 Tax=Kitasatospora sp. NPDC059160 TaxID=3346748 RepID=UPI00369F56DA
MGDSRRCQWCRAPLTGGPGQRYCPRPRTCRQSAYAARRRAARATEPQAALAQFGHELQLRVEAMREVLLQTVLAEGRAPGLLASAAADVEQHVRDLVVVAVLAERSAGASWARIGEAFGISADAARHRWRWYEIRRAPAKSPAARSGSG